MSQINVGVDWGHEHVQFVVEDAEGKSLWKARVETRLLSTALARLEELRKAAGAVHVVVGVELRAGRLVDIFLDAGFEVWFTRPEQVDEARKLVFASSAKNDYRDAAAMAWMLRSLPKESMIAVDRPTVEVIELRRLTRARAGRVVDQTAARNQLTALLREFFPELLDLAGLECRWLRQLIRLVGSPEHARQVPLDQLQALLRKHRVRRITAAALRDVLSAAQVGGNFGDWSLEVAQVLDRLDLLEKQIDALESRIADRIEKVHRADLERQVGSDQPVSDVELLRSLPGVGETTAAVMVAERLPDLIRQTPAIARGMTGVAPVLRTTGRRQTKHLDRPVMRRACSPFLRNAFHTFVEKGIQNDLWMAARYRELRGRGHTHGRACRQLGDRMLTRIGAMLRDHTLWSAPAVQALGAKAAS